MSDIRRSLPSVDKVVHTLHQFSELAGISNQRKTDAARAVLLQIRSNPPEETIPSMEEIAAQAFHLLQMERKKGLRRVVNATGIILHTGLGRAVLPKQAIAALAELDGYCSIQIDLATGRRGRRDQVCEELLRSLTECEAAMVVTNNAAATLIVLSALCNGKETIVSRGQLIEIGGSFRLPDVIAQSGARLVEVGTTNKTHARDYEQAISADTRVVLRVNPSNYRIVGFSQSVSIGELTALKRRHDVIVVDDLGCGALLDLSAYGLPREPTAQDSIQAGADVVLFSGDKLISGPQAGIIIGKKQYIDKIRKHPLARALRVGKLTIAALEATLKLFLEPDTLRRQHPTLRMLTRSLEELQTHAMRLQERISPYLACRVIDGESACGGGSLPDCSLKTALVALRHPHLSANEISRRLRMGEPPVIACIRDDWVCLDVRTLLDGDDERIENAVQTMKGLS